MINIAYLYDKFKGIYRLKVPIDSHTNDYCRKLNGTYEDVDMYIEKGMSTKDAIKEVAKQRNLNKNSVYQEYHSK